MGEYRHPQPCQVLPLSWQAPKHVSLLQPRHAPTTITKGMLSRSHGKPSVDCLLHSEQQQHHCTPQILLPPCLCVRKRLRVQIRGLDHHTGNSLCPLGHRRHYLNAYRWFARACPSLLTAHHRVVPHPWRYPSCQSPSCGCCICLHLCPSLHHADQLCRPFRDLHALLLSE